MKTMSKIIVASFLLVSSPAFVEANPVTPVTIIQQQDLAKVQTTWMKENLSLTEEQLNAVARINKEFAEEVKSIMSDTQSEKTARLEQLQDQISEKDADMKEILDNEQYAKYMEQNKKWNENLKSKMS